MHQDGDDERAKELSERCERRGVGVLCAVSDAHEGGPPQREPRCSSRRNAGRTLQSTPESGARGGYDGAKKRKGGKVHAAVDTLGHLLAVKVTAANEQDRAQVAGLAQAVQSATGENVQPAYVDQGYTGEQPAADAAAHGMKLEAIKHHEAKRGFVLLPRRWVVERSFAWAARFRRLARDYERLASTLSGYHLAGLRLPHAQIPLPKSMTGSRPERCS